MTGVERRRNTRVLFQTTASVSFGAEVFDQLAVRDLSLKGMYLEGITGRQVGERCAIQLFLSGGASELKLFMQGQVVRVDAAVGTVVHFSEVDIDSFFHLRNIVYYNAADPDQLLDELLIAATPDGSFVE